MGERTGNWFSRELHRRGVTRRDFMTFCAGLATYFALPASAAGQIAKSLEKAKKPILVWLEFQDCAGNSESFLRSGSPKVAEIILDLLSLDYHETLMAAAGKQAEAALASVVANERGKYIAIVEGSIPTGADGAYCTIGGKAAIDIAREVCGGAAATIAVGTCASFGGIPAARPNPTGALSVSDAVPGLKTIINLSACPANAENMVALLIYYMSFNHWPELDSNRRPVFAHGKSIHDNCERRAHFDAGQYVENWGDEGHRTGYCLYKVGCKGPVTFHNCPTVRWNEGTNWPIGCGHPCVGCSEPNFWDTMTPFYRHLDGIPGYSVASNLDKVGAIATGGVAAAFVGHAVVQLGRRTLFKNLVFRGDPSAPHVPPPSAPPANKSDGAKS